MSNAALHPNSRPAAGKPVQTFEQDFPPGASAVLTRYCLPEYTRADLDRLQSPELIGFLTAVEAACLSAQEQGAEAEFNALFDVWFSTNLVILRRCESMWRGRP